MNPKQNHPEGMSENSPAFQGWVPRSQLTKSRRDGRNRVSAGAGIVSAFRPTVNGFFFLLLFSANLLAQPAGKNYRFAEYFDPPNETHLRFLLEGASAQLQPGGLTFLTQAKIQNFRLSGESEIAVEAPQCVYDSSNHLINSSGPMRAQTSDGKFLIEGEGFLWQQTNTSLTISNRVHTIIHQDLLQTNRSEIKPASAPESKAMEIFSHTFNYSTNSGLGIYRENVRVVGTNLSLNSQVLTILVPMAQHQLQNVTADQSVVLTYNDIHATAERATYAADTGLAHLTGHAAWQAGPREGRGEELFIDQTNKIIRANGDAFLKLPAQDRAQSGLLARAQTSGTNSVPPTNQFVTIESESYELRTNSSVFRNHVLAQERAGEQLRGQIQCELMRLAYTGSNELQEITAEKNVSIKQEEQEFTAGKAVYSATNGVLELTDSPAWRSGPRQGSGEILLADLQHEELTARGKAFMRLPAEEFKRPADNPPGAPVSDPARQATTNTFAEIFSDEYHLSKRSALFTGNARLAHPQMTLACPTIDVQFAQTAGKIANIVAGPNVVFDLNDPKGPIHGTGERAVYSYTATPTGTNDAIELTGNLAKLDTPNGSVENRLIILDRANNKIITPGKYRMWGIARKTVGPTKY